MDDRQRMRELTDLLNRASEAYYNGNTEIMSNLEYDRLYDELVRLEEQTGVTLSDSPTVHVGYTSARELPKERHAARMLSLDKTKSREALADWLGTQTGLLSWKLDGLTVVLTYENGSLHKAVTRGNGEVGEVITDNARTFKNIPLRIPYKGTLILRGEAVIRYSDFERINGELGEEAARYKNPRNLCSGSVRQLQSEVTASRSVRFYAFALVQAQDVDFENSREKQFQFLQEQGFEVVDYIRVTAGSLPAAIEDFSERIRGYDIPSDGLVLTMDDIAYGESLGTTAKFPRNSMAFKWADEQGETTLTTVEWNTSRTGLINPVAVFEPVELEGTTVRRASVHNVSMVRSLQLGIGDRLLVYKANMIIPQIAENLTRSGTLQLPDRCPVCGAPAVIRSDEGAEVLLCTNPDCTARKLKSFVLFTSRNAMNIEGLSEMTLEKLIGCGLIHHFADIYGLGQHREKIASMEGFGEKSFEKLMAGIERSRRTTLPRVLTGLGIPGIGSAGARVLCEHFRDDLDSLRAADRETLSQIDGIGPVLAGSVESFFRDGEMMRELDALMAVLEVEKRFQEDGQEQGVRSAIAGKTFVITGKVFHFPNRDALKEYIEERGGKAASAVSSKTDYLINNDAASTSGKNKKARELGVPILTEEAFLAMAAEEGVKTDAD